MRTDKLRAHALLCLDRLRLIVEHAQHLSDMDIIRMVGDVNEIYSTYVQMPEYQENEPQTTHTCFEERIAVHRMCRSVLTRKRGDH